jgi:glycine betaine catabolism B
MTSSAEGATDTLAFRVFLWIAGSDETISPKEVDVFLRMLRSPAWARSQAAATLFPAAAEAYTSLWKRHRDGEIRRDAEPIRAALEALSRRLSAEEAAALADDLGRLATAIARASGGFVGLGAISKEEQSALAVLEQLTSDVLCKPREGVAPAPRERTSVREQAAAMIQAATASRAEQAAPPPAVWSKGPLVVRCVRIFEEARDTKTFRFVGKAPVTFRYVAGQSLVLELAIEGKKVYRSYTIASSPSRPDCLEITVKRVPGGLVSNWLHDHLREGDEVVISGPAGKFSCCFERPDRILMISGGSGVTPVMSMARWLYDTGDPADVVFLHSARTEADLIFRRELELLAARHPRFQLRFTLTDTAPEGWSGHTGRISLERLRAAVPDFMERSVYLCGPDPFMKATRALLESAGFPMARYHAESFGGVPASPRKAASHSRIMELWPTPPAIDAALVPREALEARAARLKKASSKGKAKDTLAFRDSGHEVEVDPEVTILEAAEHVGVSIPNACRSGVCGTCKIRKTKGQVEMAVTDGIEDHETEMGYVLACVTRCCGSVEVEA